MSDRDAPHPIAVYFPWVRELTGAPRSALNLMLNLDARRWRPFLITDRPNALSSAFERARLDVEILPLPPVLSLRNHEGLRLRWGTRVRALVALRRHQRELARLLRQRGAALVWARNAKGVLYAAPGAKAAGCRYVWDVGLEDPSRGPLYVLHSWALRQADLIVTQAERQPVEIFGVRRRERFAHKFRCLMPGIDPQRAEELRVAALQRPSPGPVVLSVGTIHPRKNQGLLLDAALPLLRAYPAMRLRFVGSALDGAYAESLRKSVTAAGLDARVDFLGWRDDVPQLMGRAHVLVVSSDNEGVPQVVREAMFSGLAVVSAAVGGVPDVLTHERTGLLFPRRDASTLAGLLAGLARDPAGVQSLGERARAYALERFSVERWAACYDDLLWQLVAARN